MNIKTKIKEEAIYWITCEKEGLNELEKQELKHWLESNQEHQKAYNRMKFVYQMAKSISKENAQILSEQAHKEARKIKFSEKTRYFSSAAAILLIVCFSAFKIYDNNFAIQYSKTFQTDKINLANQQLPDGSSIFIDAKTNLNIEFYKGKREVTLNNGRVMFEVAKDEQYEVIDTFTEEGKMYTWYMIIYEGRRVGWIASYNNEPWVEIIGAQ